MKTKNPRAKRTKAQAENDPASPKKKVLVIDDDPLVRRGFRFQLQGAGFEVIDAASGSEGLA